MNLRARIQTWRYRLDLWQRDGTMDEARRAVLGAIVLTIVLLIVARCMGEY